MSPSATLGTPSRLIACPLAGISTMTWSYCSARVTTRDRMTVSRTPGVASRKVCTMRLSRIFLTTLGAGTLPSSHSTKASRQETLQMSSLGPTRVGA